MSTIGIFENKLVKGIFKSRYIAAWTMEGGSLAGFDRLKFEEWLRSLSINGEKLSKEDIYSITWYAYNGKIELEESARKFLKTK